MQKMSFSLISNHFAVTISVKNNHNRINFRTIISLCMALYATSFISTYLCFALVPLPG